MIDILHHEHHEFLILNINDFVLSYITAMKTKPIISAVFENMSIILCQLNYYKCYNGSLNMDFNSDIFFVT